jgi:hypothetical protein
MKIELVKAGKVSKNTNGPPYGGYYEMWIDGVHCNPALPGPLTPTHMPPVFAGQCLA